MEFTFLSKEQVSGDNKLQVIRDYGEGITISDLAIALGARMTIVGSKKILSGQFWTRTVKPKVTQDYGAYTFCTGNAGLFRSYITKADVASCPAISPSETPGITPDNIEIIHIFPNKTVKICEYGEYPQTLAPIDIRQKLEAEYQKNALTPTGKNYTFNAGEIEPPVARRAVDVYPNDPLCNLPCVLQKYKEYHYAGKKYVRVHGKLSDSYQIFSDGTRVCKGSAYWFEVQPIKWLMDPSGTWVSKRALFSGIKFHNYWRAYGYEDFRDMSIYDYLSRYFSKEMEVKREFVETLSRLAIHNRHFSNYISGFGENKTYYPVGKDGQPFTPEKARDIVNTTNAAPFMRDLLKLIAAFPQKEQKQFENVVLSVFDKARYGYDQPAEIVVLGKKIAVLSGYEQKLNQFLSGARKNVNGLQNAQGQQTFINMKTQSK